MLTNDERRTTIDALLREIQMYGRRQESSGESIERYAVHLPYCTLETLQLTTQPDSKPAISIIEHFADPNFQPQMSGDQFPHGIRVRYDGSYDGLREVNLQGIYRPQPDGSTLLPGTSLRRSREARDNPLTNQDMNAFDAWLMYAKKELTEALPRQMSL